MVARLFDPLGLIAPVTCLGKIIIQLCWRAKIDWDEEVTPNIKEILDLWIRNLDQLAKIRIPRCVFTPGPIKRFELHAFGDASDKAYGAALYVRTIYEDDTFVHRLLIAKSKMVPLGKSHSTPKLELCAAKLVTLLVTFILRKVRNITFDQIYCWTDNAAVFYWLQKEPESWKRFVAHRVAFIQQRIDKKHWRHIDGIHNPADMASRGCTASKLHRNTFWFDGPAFLSTPEETWKVSSVKLDESIKEAEEERKSEKIVVAATVVHKNDFQHLLDARMHKETILRITAYCLRWLKPKDQRKTTAHIQLPERKRARLVWLRISQMENYSEEYNALEKGEAIPKQSSLKALDPQFDPQLRIMRVGGRIQEAPLPYEEKHPVIVPKARKNPMVDYFYLDVHQRYHHAGVFWMMEHMRKNGWWMIGGASSIRTIISSCWQCIRYIAKPYESKMGQLPKERLTPSRPFLNVGVDYTGPFYVRRDLSTEDMEKRWILLFSCMSTRAIYVVVVKDMTHETFIHAFRRLTAEYGPVENIWSDNAKTFKRASKEVGTLWQHINLSTLKMRLTETNWRFIVEHAPWWGGFYERMNRSIKSALKRVAGRAKLTEDEFVTLMCEIQSQVNSRPLGRVNQCPGQLTVSPSDLIKGYNVSSECAAQENAKKDVPLTNRWNYREEMKNHFWRVWKANYLLELAHFQKWRTDAKACQVGDIVLVNNDKKRHLWPTGVIESIQEGRDKRIRSAVVHTADGTFRRPVQLLHPLEMPDAESTDPVQLAGSGTQQDSV
jgi:hypothetical protein